MININNLIQKEKDDKLFNRQIINLCELILVLSSVSSNKDMYLDRISESDEKYVNGYLNIIEKYINFDTDNISTNGNVRNSRKLTVRTSALYSYNDINKTYQAIEKLNKKIEDLENDKKFSVKEMEEYRNKLIELEEKLKLMKREAEILKEEKNKNDTINENILIELEEINYLKEKLNQKENEIEEIKKDNNKMIKKYIDKISALDSKIEHLNDKDEEYKLVIEENERLKLKCKEFVSYKEKYSNYDELMNMIKTLTLNNENIQKEKAGVINQMEKYNKEIVTYKEKNRQLEFDLQKLTYELEEEKNHLNLLQNDNNIKKNQTSAIFNKSMKKSSIDLFNYDINLGSLDKNFFAGDIDAVVEERLVDIKKEIEEQRVEKTTQINKLRESIFYITGEKENISKEKEKLENELKEEKEKSKILIENSIKEKNIKFVELENKYKDLELEKNNLEQIIESTNARILEITKEKKIYQKQLEQTQEQLDNSNTMLEKVIAEKQKYVMEFENFKTKTKNKKEKGLKELKQLRAENEELKQKSKEMPKIGTPSTKGRLSTNENYIEIVLKELKKEIETLKNTQSSHLDMIKFLNEKNKSLENENKSLNNQINENVNKFNKEIQERNEDLEFIKQAYDEQKNKVNKEYEIVNNSLYELTIQFMQLKNEMNKKQNKYFLSPKEKVMK